MHFFELNSNLEGILAITGMVFGVISLILLWIYMIGAVRKASVPDYSDFRININLAYLFSILLLGFICLTGSFHMVAFAQNLLIIQLICWVVTAIGAIVMLAVSRQQRPYTKPALSASLIKLALTALVIWIFA